MSRRQEDTTIAFAGCCADAAQYCYHTAHLRAISSDLCLDEPCAVLIGITGGLALTKSQLAIFCALLDARGCPMSASALAARLPSASSEVPLIKTVRNSVCLLRKRLAQISRCVHIRTRYSYGYYLWIDSDASLLDTAAPCS